MNIRKGGVCLLIGLVFCLATVYLLFPFQSDASNDKEAKRKDLQSTASSDAPTLPNYDAFLAEPTKFAEAVAARQSEKTARVNQFETRLDVPTFLWANADQSAFAPTTQKGNRGKQAIETAKSAARFYLGANAAQYRLGKTDLAAVEVASVHDTGNGGIIVKFKQNIDGVEVFRDEINVMMNRNYGLIAMSGYLTSTNPENGYAERAFLFQPEDAVAKAISDLMANSVDGSILQRIEKRTAGEVKPQNDYVFFNAYNSALKGFSVADDTLRAKKVFFHLADGFVPAYYVEANVDLPQTETAATQNLYYSYVISATDGRVLFRNNLTAHQEYSYRVFAESTPPYTPFDSPNGIASSPHPTGLPDGYAPSYVTQNLLTLQNAPYSQGKPWLPPGATTTTGNNAEAYADLVAPDGYNDGDLRADLTAPGVFDRSFNPNALRTETEQRKVAITQLFFNVNYLHDDFYDAGFNEAAGNAQNDNYGFGGLGNDSIKAEAQDFSGRNNANMSTPADGGRPRMQMYLFDGPVIASLTVNSPSSIAGQKAVGVATGFGPQAFDVTGNVVIADDGTAPANDACTALTNSAAIAGKIAFVDRGLCNFDVKVRNAQNAGAIGVIIADNASGAVAGIGGMATDITIPAVRITLADGNAIRNATGVNVRLYREAVRDLDGTLDNQVVAHEWGHYISNRLIVNSNGLTNNQGRSMGEGWGDFHSMLMTVRPEDINIPANSNWNGVYAMGAYATGNGANNSYYYGIRRAPYSVDFNKNPLTFKHISDAAALPTNAPIKNLGVNSEVHNSGEVWTEMLWECYVSLLRAHPFAEARDRMKFYLVASYKMTPASPTYTEARDALMAAAIANDPADGQRFAFAFAKRGIGVRAVAPDRASTNHAGVVESNNTGGDLAFVAGSLTDASGDRDGYLDNGETGIITINVKNIGFQSLSQTMATISSSNPHISFPNGASFTVSSSQPFSSSLASGSIVVSASNMSGIETANFTITMSDPGITLGAPTGSFAARLNANEVPNSIFTDDAEALGTTWTLAKDATLDTGNLGRWRRTRPAGGVTNQLWLGPDAAVAADNSMISPTLIVGSTGGFTMAFDHSYSFESDASGNYDGGVIEMSVDNGATWTDIGTSAYTGTLIDYADNLNPLRNRQAFVGTGAQTRTTITVASTGRVALAPGSAVKVRFRVGSDNNTGAGGWQVDNITFSGITNRPFTSVVGLSPTAAGVSVAGRVIVPTDLGLNGAQVTLTDSHGISQRVLTNKFGQFSFTNVAAGETYVLQVKAKRYTYAPQVITVTQNLTGLEIAPEQQN